MPKLIAFHLPQFHTIPENDEWWGEGFTEWVNTRKAKPLFKNHYQPREPLNDRYYDLSREEDIRWQCELAKKYNVDGFCFYHYWFNGKLLLEKPVEILLNKKEINFPFMLCWANEPWTRAWDGGDKEVIMPQKYGDENDWKEHYNYLSEFFKDNRYIKVNNKPVFVIYRTNNVVECEKMIEFWEKCCKEDGFDGIHIVEEVNSFQNKSYCKNSNAVLQFEPMYTIVNDTGVIEKISNKFKNLGKRILKIETPIFYDYDKVWKKIISRRMEKEDKQIYPGSFVDWDNSARKGLKSTIFKGATPEKFAYYINKQYEKAKDIGSDFIFINAWNEWAEGTYLEPDKKNGYKYLEKIKEIKGKNKV